jgi:hypothetical protein
VLFQFDAGHPPGERQPYQDAMSRAPDYRPSACRRTPAREEIPLHTIKAPEKIDHRRRRFFGAAGITLAAAQFGMVSAAAAQTGGTNTNTSFGALKQIDAGLLNIGYAEAGPADGPPIILLHGWPYDIHASPMSRRCWRRRGTA